MAQEVKEILKELQDMGFPISLVSANTGITHSRLYNTFNNRPARFDSKEIEQLLEYKKNAAKLKKLADSLGFNCRFVG